MRDFQKFFISLCFDDSTVNVHPHTSDNIFERAHDSYAWRWWGRVSSRRWTSRCLSNFLPVDRSIIGYIWAIEISHQRWLYCQGSKRALCDNVTTCFWFLVWLSFHDFRASKEQIYRRKHSSFIPCTDSRFSKRQKIYQQIHFDRVAHVKSQPLTRFLERMREPSNAFMGPMQFLIRLWRSTVEVQCANKRSLSILKQRWLSRLSDQRSSFTRLLQLHCL